MAWAKLLGRGDVAKLLNTNLKEEKATDKKLRRHRQAQNQQEGTARKKPRPDEIERAENALLVATAGVPAIWLAAGRALRVDVKRIKRMRSRHEQAVALGAAETKIGAALRQRDVADRLALRT